MIVSSVLENCRLAADELAELIACRTQSPDELDLAAVAAKQHVLDLMSWVRRHPNLPIETIIEIKQATNRVRFETRQAYKRIAP